MNQRGSYAPIGRIATSIGPHRAAIALNSGMQPGISSKEHRTVGSTQHPAAPKGAVALAKRPAREMLGGNAGQMKLSDTAFIPPISLDYFASSAMAEKVRCSERRIPDSSRVALDKAGDCRSVQVVVVVVGENNQSIGGNRSNSTPGGTQRRGPANCSGEARSLQMGSIRMLRPAIWTRKLVCPTHVRVSMSGFSAGTMN